MGDNSMSQLGRSTRNVDPKTFGPVPMAEPILAVASGGAHCLAMTADKVFAFGYDNYGQTGVGRRGLVKEPTEIYRGTGNKAPCQISAGWFHSAILTTGGQALTCGRGDHGSTGHGETKHIYKPTPVKSIKGNVEQIGCTGWASFFLADGKMFGCGLNSDSSLGVGHDKEVKIPTLLRTDGHIITSFRCSYSLVVAYTQLRDALVWGECEGKVIIKAPQVERLEYPRDFFSRGTYKDTGGAVFPDIQRYRLEAMKDLSAKMVQLKMEITRSGESSGQGGVSSEEHEAERLAEHGRLMEENTTLQTQLTSEKAERVALESKSTQQQKAYEHLLAQHNTLLSDHDMLKKEHESVHNTYDEEKREHNTLKTVHQELKSNYQNLQVKLDECKRALSKLISLPLLHVVVNMVGKKWERLGIKLGVPDFVLEQIDHLCLHLPDKALVTINKWYELAPEEATTEKLADCLEFIERKDIADRIRVTE